MSSQSTVFFMTLLIYGTFRYVASEQTFGKNRNDSCSHFDVDVVTNKILKCLKDKEKCLREIQNATVSFTSSLHKETAPWEISDAAFFSTVTTETFATTESQQSTTVNSRIQSTKELRTHVTGSVTTENEQAITTSNSNTTDSTDASTNAVFPFTIADTTAAINSDEMMETLTFTENETSTSSMKAAKTTVTTESQQNSGSGPFTHFAKEKITDAATPIKTDIRATKSQQSLATAEGDATVSTAAAAKAMSSSKSSETSLSEKIDTPTFFAETNETFISTESKTEQRTNAATLVPTGIAPKQNEQAISTPYSETTVIRDAATIAHSPSTSAELLDDGWFTPRNGYQYKFIDEFIVYAEIKNKCKVLGAKLAAAGIRNETIRRAILSYPKISKNSKIWIGLSRAGFNQPWIWSDGVKPANLIIQGIDLYLAHGYHSVAIIANSSGIIQGVNKYFVPAFPLCEKRLFSK